MNHHSDFYKAAADEQAERELRKPDPIFDAYWSEDSNDFPLFLTGRDHAEETELRALAPVTDLHSDRAAELHAEERDRRYEDEGTWAA